MEKTPAQTTLLRGGLGTAALAMLTLTACSTDEVAEFEEGEPAGQVEETSEEDLEETEAPEQGEDDDAEDAPEDEEDEAAQEEEDDDADDDADSSDQEGPLDPEDAIETIVYEVPGDSNMSVEVGLHSLRVVDEVMLLELSFTPEFNEREAQSIWGMFGGERIYPALSDRENMKSYGILGPDQHNLWATPNGPMSSDYESGQTAPYWAYYSAPVDDIDTLTVTVVSGAVEFEDVEIDWDGNDPRGSDGADEDDSADEDADAQDEEE